MRQFIKERAVKSWQNSLRSHRFYLKKDENKLRLAIAAGLFLYFFTYLLDTDWKLAVSFMFAGGMALYSGVVYKGREVMGFVLVGVVLAATLPNVLVPGIRESFSQGNYVGTAILIGVGIYLFNSSSTLKKGSIPEDWTKREKPKRKQKRKRAK